jgi:AraC-like DNA-binding protein
VPIVTKEAARTRPDDIERAHLLDPADTSFSIGRFGPRADLEAVIRRFWLPVWSVPPGDERTQQVLQYPVALIVVAHDYARCYGVQPGLSETTLVGDGWACGVMLQPAGGHLLTGRPMAELTGRHVDLGEVLDDADDVVGRIRAAMAPDPRDPDRQRVAAAVLEDRLTSLLPLGPEAELVNDVVALAEGKPDLVRVAELADAFGLTERGLQRLTARWLGLTPKWLIQRRRLQEAAERLRSEGVALAGLAADLGYADQAHFNHDWRRVTGMTPGEFAGRFASPARRR